MTDNNEPKPLMLDRYAMDWLDKVVFKASTGQWCNSGDVVLLENKLALTAQRIKDLEADNEEILLAIESGDIELLGYDGDVLRSHAGECIKTLEDELSQEKVDSDDLRSQRTIATKRIKDMEDYLTHKPRCNKVLSRMGGQIVYPCNCGLDELMGRN